MRCRLRWFLAVVFAASVANAQTTFVIHPTPNRPLRRACGQAQEIGDWCSLHQLSRHAHPSERVQRRAVEAVKQEESKVCHA